MADDATRKKPKYKVGKFKEPIFPDSEVEMDTEFMTRYQTTAPFEDVARFYEAIFGGLKRIQLSRVEIEGFPGLAVGVHAKAGGVEFSSMVVMVDRNTIKKRKQLYQIMAVGR